MVQWINSDDKKYQVKLNMPLVSNLIVNEFINNLVINHQSVQL